MDERMVSICWSVDGTLAAGKSLYWTLPFGLTLHHVAAVGSNANDATLSIGITGALAAAMAATAIGDSGVPVEFTLADFVDTVSPYHFEKGDVLTLTVDHDGAVGVAVANLQIVLTGLVG
jgi:hypothetical protein